MAEASNVVTNVRDKEDGKIQEKKEFSNEDIEAEIKYLLNLGRNASLSESNGLKEDKITPKASTAKKDETKSKSKKKKKQDQMKIKDEVNSNSNAGMKGGVQSSGEEWSSRQHESSVTGSNDTGKASLLQGQRANDRKKTQLTKVVTENKNKRATSASTDVLPVENLNAFLNDSDFEGYKSKEILLEALRKDGIILVQKPPKRFPNSQYVCCVCEWHMDKGSDCQKHVSDKKHLNKMKGISQSNIEKMISSITEKDQKQNKPQTDRASIGNKTKLKMDNKSKNKEDSNNMKKSVPKGQDESDSEDMNDNDVDDFEDFDGDSGILDMNDKTPENILKVALEKEKIFPLKKKSVRFPRAQYFCRLCDYHMDTVSDCKKHVKDNRHRRRNEVSRIERKLKLIPSPCPEQLAKLDELVEDLWEKHGLTQSDIDFRTARVDKLALVLKNEELLKDTELHMYGSSLTGMGLKNCDVNIDLVVPQKVNQAKALTHAFKVLKENNEYLDVKSDFSAKVPCIYFSDKELKCQMTIGSELACLTSRLIRQYALCDHRVLKVGVILKLWAEICRVDRQEEGTMPSYCTSLMAIHYLQSCKPPILPILYESCDENGTKTKEPITNRINFMDIERKTESWKSENTESVGALWLGTLKYYCLTFEHQNNIVSVRQTNLLRSEKKWNSKRLAIEDPFSTKRNVTRSVKSFEMFEYIWDCVRKSYYYFGMPSNFEKLSKNQRREFLMKSKPCSDQTENNMKLKDTCKTESQNQVIADSKSDIIHSTPNLSVNSQSQSDDPELENSLLQANPKCEKCDILLNDSVSKECPGKINSKATPPRAINIQSTRDICDKYLSIDKCKDSDINHQDSLEQEKRLHIFARSIVDKVLTGALSILNTSSTCEVQKKRDSEFYVSSSDSVLQSSESVSREDRSDSPIAPEYKYVFTDNTLSDGKGPAVICVLCEKEGHLKTACPEDSLPELKPLKPMTKHHLQLLSSVLRQVPRDFGLNGQEMRERENIRKELEMFIQELFPTSRLHLFGSSHNGFGFRHSDLDLCCTLDDIPTPENLDLVAYIEKITKKLKTHKGLYNVIAITTAKVPIVKFKHRSSQLEGDISMYNLLALYNTRMVSLYASMDSRVQILGYALKVLAKICDIGDASRGSLSSYAYTLMMLYYLQQCKPPVIPVLQELHPPGKKPERIVDGWNTWYFDDMNKLSSMWSCENTQNVGELWEGFFRFYTESFNLRDHVVCIRQLEQLSRFEKLWNGTCIAIEDPFDLNHNLGAGLSRKMNQYIMQTLVHGRALYCNPVADIPPTFSTLADYFFDKEQLTSGSPPNDRCCRVCNKIGHIAKECPVVLNRKEREERDRKRKEEIRCQKEEESKLRLQERATEWSKGRGYEYNSNQRQSGPGPLDRGPHSRDMRRSLSDSSDYDTSSYSYDYDSREERNKKRKEENQYQREEVNKTRVQERVKDWSQGRGYEYNGNQRQPGQGPSDRGPHSRDMRRSLSESSDYDTSSYGYDRMSGQNTHYYYNTSNQRTPSGTLAQGHMSPMSSSGPHFQKINQQQQYHHGNLGHPQNRFQRVYQSGPQHVIYPTHQSPAGKSPGRGRNYNQVVHEEGLEHPWIQQFVSLPVTSLPQAQVDIGSTPLATNTPQTMVTSSMVAPYYYYYPMYTVVSEAQQGTYALPAVASMPVQASSPLQTHGGINDNMKQYNHDIPRADNRYNTGRPSPHDYSPGSIDTRGHSGHPPRR